MPDMSGWSNSYGNFSNTKNECETCKAWFDIAFISHQSGPDFNDYIKGNQDILLAHLEKEHPEMLKDFKRNYVMQKLFERKSQEMSQAIIDSRMEDKTIPKLDTVE